MRHTVWLLNVPNVFAEWTDPNIILRTNWALDYISIYHPIYSQARIFPDKIKDGLAHTETFSTKLYYQITAI
jgi:hypothetical protein